jgi:N-methylhydantoinase A/oxoprolinase/acetone carboxylase beta subunit
MFDERRWQEGQLVSRGALGVGKSMRGPALLEDPTSTLLVTQGWTAMRDENDNTILKRKT